MGALGTLFSFEGRLRRRDWWLCSIALLIANVVLVEIGMRLLGATSMPFTAGEGYTFDEDRWLLQRLEVQVVVSLVLGWPVLATSFKRLHDRGHTGRAFVLFWIVFWIGQALGEAGRLTSDGTSGLLRLSALLLLLVVVFIGFWLLILLGVLDGNAGTNRFGPSPKAEAALPSPALAD